MTFEILFMFFLLILALILFSTNFVSFDVAALILLVVLLLTGILTPAEGFSGLSNPATITIGAMFVISEALRRTGLISDIGNFFCNKMEQNFWFWMILMMMFVSAGSAFMNNTAIIIIFIPILIEIAAKLNISASKLLMPLGFAGIMGGTSTLIGTSANLLASSIMQERTGMTFNLFDFTPMGIIFLATGFIYIFTVGYRFIPPRRKKESSELTDSFEMQSYLTDLVVNPSSPLVGKEFDEKDLTRELDLDVLRIFKPNSDTTAQRSRFKLEAGNVLRVRGSAEEIDKLTGREDLSIKYTERWKDTDLKIGHDALVEATISPDSAIEGQKLESIDFPDRFGAIPLAIRHKGRLQQEQFGKIVLRGGDSLLLNMNSERLRELDENPSFLITSEVDIFRPKKKKIPLVLAILAVVVGSAAFNLLPISVAAPAGVVLLLITGCLSTEEAYRAVNWKIIVLIAGVLPLGTAMDKTGTANLLAETVIHYLQDFGPRAVLSGFYLLTMAITAIISTSASIVLLAPIAIEVANQIGVNVQPFILAVSFAASLTFFTPIGHHANTLVYGPGQFKFTDYTRIGLPLNIIFWILASLFLPLLWPF
jgi:di/tricarboxylate transporter